MSPRTDTEDDGSDLRPRSHADRRAVGHGVRRQPPRGRHHPAAASPAPRRWPPPIRRIGETLLTSATARLAARATSGWSVDLVRQAAEAAADELMAHGPAVRARRHRRAPRGRAHAGDGHHEPGRAGHPVRRAPRLRRRRRHAVDRRATARTPASSTGRSSGAGASSRRSREWADGERRRPARARGPTATATTTRRCSPAVGHPVAVNPDVRLAGAGRAARLAGPPPRPPRGRAEDRRARAAGVDRVPAADRSCWPTSASTSPASRTSRTTGPVIVVFNHRSYFDGSRRRHRPRRRPVARPLPRQEGGVRRAGHRRVRRGWPAASGSNRSSGSDEPLEAAIKVLAGRRGHLPGARGHDPARAGVLRPELKGRWGAARLAAATRRPGHPRRPVGHREGVAAHARLPQLSFTERPEIRGARRRPGPAQAPQPRRRHQADHGGARRPAARPRPASTRTPTAEELAATYPPGYRGDPTAEAARRPGTDT